MDTEIIRLADPGGPERALKAGSEILKRGGVVLLPTDTVYGLAVDGRNPAAVARVYRIKRRPPEKPLVRLVADLETVIPLLGSPARVRLLEKFWPGALTVILKAPEGESRGYRIPDHNLVRELIRAAGVELAATSANRSGEPVITSPGEAGIFAGEVELIVDGGTLSGAASTVLDLSVSPFRVHREGPVTETEIRRILGAGD